MSETPIAESVSARSCSRAQDVSSLEGSIRALPKADVHVHLEGCVDDSALQVLSDRNKISLRSPVVLSGRPEVPPPAGLENGFSTLRSLEDFVRAYIKTSECIAGGEDLLFIAERYLTRAKSDNVVRSEIYFTPITFRFLGRNMEDLFDGLVATEKLAIDRFDLEVSWVFDMVRSLPEFADETLRLARSARKQGVSVKSIGLAGDERKGAAHLFSRTVGDARSDGFSVLVHAGETGQPQSIREALEALNPVRIGHGIAAVSDPDLLDALAERKIPVEVCPWSNVLLGLVEEDRHPIARMVQAGLAVVIASDDPGIFGKGLVDNYLLAARSGLTLEDLSAIAELSLKC